MSILAVLELTHDTHWHRMSWETLAAAQQLSAALGQPLEAAVVGNGIGVRGRGGRHPEIGEGMGRGTRLVGRLHSRRLHGCDRTTDPQATAVAGAVSPYLSSARLRPQAGHPVFAGAGERRDRGARRKRSAHLCPPVLSGQVERRRANHGNRPGVCVASGRRLAGGWTGEWFGAGGIVRARSGHCADPAEAGAALPGSGTGRGSHRGRNHSIRRARYQGTIEHFRGGGSGARLRRRAGCLASDLRCGLAPHGTASGQFRADGSAEDYTSPWASPAPFSTWWG